MPDSIAPSPRPQDFALFIPITKVDAARREVYGYGVVEEVDKGKQPEIFDYASSKPLVLKVAEETRQRTGGKSLFPVREMHDSKAAGKVIQIKADDTRKGFYLTAKVVDDGSWNKVEEGVLTGFSIGGSYANRWWDMSKNAYRYTAQPVEFSLVDVPCVPSATFDLIKSDGTLEKRHFKNTAEDAPAASPDLSPIQPNLTGLTAVFNELGEALAKAKHKLLGDAEVTAEHADEPDLGKTAEAESPSNTIQRREAGLPDLPLEAQATLPTDSTLRPAITEVVQQFEQPTVPTSVNGTADSGGIVTAPASQIVTDATRPLTQAQAGEVFLGKLEALDARLNGIEKVVALAKQADAEWEKLVGIGLKPFTFIDLGKAAIPTKEGEPKTPPKGYPKNRAEYGDPANYSFPCDTTTRCLAAVRYYNAGSGKKVYNDREWAILGRRIARLASRKTGNSYKFDPRTKQIERAEENKPNGGK